MAIAELYLLFLQAFHLAVLFDSVRVDDILANVDIWVIPMLNPDGRYPGYRRFECFPTEQI
jgi:hypothetical protein